MDFLAGKGCLESFTAEDLRSLAEALLDWVTLRVQATAVAARKGGDVDGAFVAAYDGYRMRAESLLAVQGLRATGGDGSHMTIEDAVSAQFGKDIPAFAKPMFDLFHARVDGRFVARVWDVMARTPQHTYQDLTKRPERLSRVLGAVQAQLELECWPLPNVWLGTSVESDDRVRRADYLSPASRRVVEEQRRSAMTAASALSMYRVVGRAPEIPLNVRIGSVVNQGVQQRSGLAVPC